MGRPGVADDDDARRRRRTVASSATPVRPAEVHAGPAAADAPRASARSPSLPVTTTRWPGRPSGATTSRPAGPRDRRRAGTWCRGAPRRSGPAGSRRGRAAVSSTREPAVVVRRATRSRRPAPAPACARARARRGGSGCRWSSSVPGKSVADAVDPLDAGQPQQQRRRQRRLVERGEDQRLGRRAPGARRGRAQHLALEHPRRRVGRSTGSPTPSTLSTPGSNAAAAGRAGRPSSSPCRRARPPRARPGRRSGRRPCCRAAPTRTWRLIARPPVASSPASDDGDARQSRPRVAGAAATSSRRRDRRSGTSTAAATPAASPASTSLPMSPTSTHSDGVDAERGAPRRLTMPGLRLAAVAAVPFAVRAVLDVVERAEQLVDARVDRLDLLGGEQPAGDARLVADHAVRSAAARSRASASAAPRHRPHQLRVAVVGHVLGPACRRGRTARRGRRRPRARPGPAARCRHSRAASATSRRAGWRCW